MRRLVFAFAASAVVLASTLLGVTSASATSSSGASSLLSSNGSVGYSITFLRPSQLTSLRGRWDVPGLVSGNPTSVRPPVGAVPEPAALLAFGAGALIIAGALRRRA
jgi:hypothetical protein